jgi:hypothetical protein
MHSHTAARSALSLPGNASRSWRSIRSEPSALVRVTPAGSSTNAAPPSGRELGDASERVGVGERAFALGVDDRVELARLMAAGVADGLLALGVGPAGAVGDQFAVVADEQPADDLSERAEVGVRRVDQAGADVVAEAEVAAGGVGVAGSRLCSALLVFGGRVA